MVTGCMEHDIVMDYVAELKTSFELSGFQARVHTVLRGWLLTVVVYDVWTSTPIITRGAFDFLPEFAAYVRGRGGGD